MIYGLKKLSNVAIGYFRNSFMQQGCLLLIFFLSFYVSNLSATPVGELDAKSMVENWLRCDSKPLGTSLGSEIKNIESFTDVNNQPIYYVVYLKPKGFVIVPADDQVEPIIAFAEDGRYELSPENHLGVLVSQDLPNRISTVRKYIKSTKNKSIGQLNTDSVPIGKRLIVTI